MATHGFSRLFDVASAYRGAPLGTRLHVYGRFLSCPFSRTLPYLPPRARLLDIGAGHGLFARLALGAGARQVVTIEPDLAKVCATPPRAGVLGVVGYAGAVGGSFDAVSLYDVLCRVPIELWDGILTYAYDRLRPGGLLLLKEIDNTRPGKAAWNRWQEKGADFLGLTLGAAFSYEPPPTMMARLSAVGFAEPRMVPIGDWYPHAHMLYLATK